MRIFRSVASAALFFAGFAATAQTTNTLSGAEIQGRQLARELLEQQPAENSTNAGVLQIQDPNGARSEFPVDCKVTVTQPDSTWTAVYEAGATNQRVTLTVVHAPGLPNRYFYRTNAVENAPFGGHELAGPQLMVPFAGSDFWIADLGLEFLHWPAQAILRGDTARGRLCKVLESTDPEPFPRGYSRVDSWIDNETLGIVEARAYDADGKLLKEFYPRDVKKVEGQWQVGSMEIDNVQTGSRTWLKFDLKAH